MITVGRQCVIEHLGNFTTHLTVGDFQKDDPDRCHIRYLNAPRLPICFINNYLNFDSSIDK